MNVLTLVVAVVYVAVTAALVPLFAFLGLITAAALVPRRRPARPTAGEPPRFLIVIPAHDEEAGIRATVLSCAAVDYDPDRRTISVIADNCTDGTAAEARAAGALVVERFDAERRSKGYALEHFFEAVPEARPDSGAYDAAVIVDADTVVGPGLLSAFAEGLAGGASWIQGYYSVRNPDVSWRTRLLALAFGLRNGTWPSGLDRLGLSVGLMGNGMCFSAEALRRFPWRAYGLVEDAEFGLMLRVEGERVRFARRAAVFGEMVSRGGEAAAGQRRRWEAGRRALRDQFLGLLLRSEAIGPFRKAAYVIDLLFPPLATLGLILVLATSLHAWALVDDRLDLASRLLAPIHATMASILAVYALSPVIVLGLPVRYLSGILFLPYYAAWKLLKASGRPPAAWVRTRREG